jgi:sulfate adenylyltransferase subunit 1
VDLIDETGPLELVAAASFIDYLGKGNRVLFRLRDLGQVAAVALLAYEQTLSFEFDRTAGGVSVLLFRRSSRKKNGIYSDDGTGI